MKRLRGVDAAFLYLETPSQHMHISATMILEPIHMHAAHNDEQPSGAETAAANADVAARRLSHVLLTRLSELPAFRRSLTDALARLTHPAWINAPHFDPGDHLRYETLPSPGTLDQLADVVAVIAATPLDRSRPLWELWTVGGLEGGRVAMVVKVHHAMLDGVSGLEVLARLFTTEPGGPEQASIDVPVDDDRSPSSTEPATSVLASIARLPTNVTNTLAQAACALLPLARSSILLARSTLRPSLPFSSPRTTLNHALTPGRAVAFGRVSLESLKRVGHAFSVTVNDVVLAACTLALREYLRCRGERPKRAIIAIVPVSHHAHGDGEALGNRVSAMFVGLPVHLDVCTDILHAVHEQSVAAKRMHAAFGPNLLADWAELAPPALFRGAAALYSRWKLAEHIPTPHSVVISNVAGPSMPLYATDARLVATYPLGPIVEGALINITVLSYAGSVDIGLTTCPKSVPRPAEVARTFERAVADLDALAIDSFGPVDHARSPYPETPRDAERPAVGVVA